MSYLTALGYVLAIIAIVIVGGVIIAFLGKIVIGIFDADRKLGTKVDDDPEQEIINIRDNVYNQQPTSYKAEPVNNVPVAQPKVEEKFVDEEEDYNYAKDIDAEVAKRERAELEKELKGDDDFFADYKKTLETSSEPDDLDLMSMIDEISNDVLEDKKTEVQERTSLDSKKNSSMLDKYSIDNLLDDEDEEDDEDEDEALEVSPANSGELEEMRNIKTDIMTMLEEIRGNKAEDKEDEEEKINAEVARRVDEKLEENLKVIEDLKKALEEKEAEVQTAKDEHKELEEKYSNINKQMVEQFQSQNREIENQIQSTMSQSMDQISELKKQLADLTQQLQEERAMNWKVVETASKESAPATKDIKVVESDVVEEKATEDFVIDAEIIEAIEQEQVDAIAEEKIETTTIEVNEITKKVEELTQKPIVEEVVSMQYNEEAQYLQRIEVLEERLRIAKKDLKINDKEYKPLEKVKRTLDRDKAKLRRKEAIAAKKKVALYGVNNYVDIDKEKAEKLAHELELLDGLRLSVSHCEEVMNANKERYPILEHTHFILTTNIRDLETDLAQLNKELQILRDKKDND